MDKPVDSKSRILILAPCAMDHPFTPDFLSDLTLTVSAAVEILRFNLFLTHKDTLSIRRDIACLEDEILSTKEPKNDTFKALAVYRALLAPVRKLHLELLSKIFLLLRPPGYGAPHLRSVPPLLFCDVSHAWRAAAIATPFLWDSLKIDGCSVSTVERWLGFSGNVPLSLEFVKDERLTDDMKKVILAYAGQWKSIIAGVETAYSLFQDSSIPLPRLETLHIWSRVRTQLPGDLVFTERTPSLRHATFEIECHSFYAHLVDFPWAQLTTLDISREIYGEEFMVIMAQCRDLRLLHVDGIYGNFVFSKERSIVLPWLETCIFHPYVPDVPNYLPFFTMPRLRSMSVYCPGAWTWPRGEFNAFIIRSSPPLQNLNVMTSDSFTRPNEQRLQSELLTVIDNIPSLLRLSVLPCIGKRLVNIMSDQIERRMASRRESISDLEVVKGNDWLGSAREVPWKRRGVLHTSTYRGEFPPSISNLIV